MTDQISRRDFLKLASITGGGLALAVFLDGCAPAPDEVIATAIDITPTTAAQGPFDWAPNIYLKLDNQGMLTVMAFRSEMGQGIRTALAMLVADELDVDWSAVRIEQVPADKRYGDQVTGGSLSISRSYQAVRNAGAAARQMLVSAAAQAWSVDPAQCQTEVGFVIHPDGETKFAYGDLAEAASKLEIPRDVKVKEKSQLRIVGQARGHWDATKILMGKATYGLDVRLPEMLFAVMARCPVFDGDIASYDDSAARAVSGVRDVVQIGKKIAVVAEHSWGAIQGRKALTVEWDEGRNADLNSAELTAKTLETLPVPGLLPDQLDAVYVMPYEAHATMEPMNCTAHVHDEICEVWAPTQNPQEVQANVASALKIGRDKVTVNVTLIGGGFGRRLQTDYAVEAALVSQAVGAPVQVFWTRDDDFQHDFYQGMAVQYARVPLDKISKPILITKRGPSAIPTGAWRSVDNPVEAYATQCLIDEVATALKRDPLEVLLEIYSGRAAGVIQLAAEKASWGSDLPPGWGRGLAYHATFGVTHVAMVAEVSVDTAGNVRVQRMVCAVDCGAVVNPDNVAAQMESGVVFGLTVTLKSEVTIKNGRVEQSSFYDHPLPHIDEMPKVETYIIESEEKPTGIGEMGVPPVAPAVANAVFAATRKRIRHIPIRAEDLKDN